MSHCYLIIHGINTNKSESACLLKDFKTLLKDLRCDAEVIDGSYGLVKTWHLAIPFIGRAIHGIITHMMGQRIERLSKEYDEVIILAHSNGTHVALRSIEKLEDVKNIYLGLFGGTIRCSYNFEHIEGKVPGVFNFCSTRDWVVNWWPKIIGRGSSGHYGFRYKHGQKANTHNGRELVWNEKIGAHPFVLNYHINNVKHSQWIEKPKYFHKFMQEFSKYKRSPGSFF